MEDDNWRTIRFVSRIPVSSGPFFLRLETPLDPTREQRERERKREQWTRSNTAQVFTRKYETLLAIYLDSFKRLFAYFNFNLILRFLANRFKQRHHHSRIFKKFPPNFFFERHLTSCTGATCHARREFFFFIPKLQYLLGFKCI